MRRLTAYERELYRAASDQTAPWCLVQSWPWWWRDFQGIALSCLILVKDPRDPLVVCHEVAHVAQFYAAPFTFWFRYVRACVLFGYRKNCYEQQARAIAARARQLIADGTCSHVPESGRAEDIENHG